MELKPFTFVYAWESEYWYCDDIPIVSNPEPFRVLAHTQKDADACVDRVIAEKFGEWKQYLEHRITFEGMPKSLT
ncbi:hypothetical protein AB0B15_17175 [Streptomyces sp. NPDC045456]|uniref:hypothetical protein n=1 Tax=unclassified Streptomyces TaxID=2593676 RepID=UPI0033C541F4